MLCAGIALAIWFVTPSHGFSADNIDSKTNETPLKPVPASLNLPYICRNPQPDNYRHMINKGAPLTNLPVFNARNPFSVDLRSADASHLDLRDSAADLEHANYDSQTIWPPKDRMPPTFDAGRILELGKNPGLGIRGLHAQGITGRGISIGIVDLTLLTRHPEFAGRIKWYEEINVEGWRPSEMHGPAVASIAVGKTVGVAPEADLYYIAIRTYEMSSILHNYAQGVQRLLEVNRRLPKEHRIRAISMSIGYGPGTPGYEDFIAAVKEAEAQGIFVAWCGSEQFPIDGLGISPSADRDDFNAYVIPQRYHIAVSGSLFVPMDSRTTASPTGVNDYVFYGPGGESWTVPYVAGAYALAAQVSPDLTPEQFWSLAIQTGHHLRMKDNGRDVDAGQILNPAALIKALADKKERIK
jgi:hypothetical protein